jgi:hypothetical protein
MSKENKVEKVKKLRNASNVHFAHDDNLPFNKTVTKDSYTAFPEG